MRELVNALVARAAEVKLLTPRLANGPGVHCESVDIDTDDLLPTLRRLTARIDGGGGAAAIQASEVHGLLLNEYLLQHLERLHARWPIELVYERYSLWSHAGLRFARRHRIPFLLEVNAPLAAQQEAYRRLFLVQLLDREVCASHRGPSLRQQCCSPLDHGRRVLPATEQSDRPDQVDPVDAVP